MIAPSLPPTLTQNPAQHTRLRMKSGRLSWQRKKGRRCSRVFFLKKVPGDRSCGRYQRHSQTSKKRFATAVSRYQVDTAKVQEHDHASLAQTPILLVIQPAASHGTTHHLSFWIRPFFSLLISSSHIFSHSPLPPKLNRIS